MQDPLFDSASLVCLEWDRLEQGHCHSHVLHPEMLLGGIPPCQISSMAEEGLCDYGGAPVARGGK